MTTASDAPLARVRAGRNPAYSTVPRHPSSESIVYPKGTDPRVSAILSRFHDQVTAPTRETLDMFAELAAVDPTLELPPLPHRHKVQPL